MKVFFDNIRSIIALLVVVLSYTFLFMITKTVIPPANLPVVQTVAGLVLAGLGVAIGYYFGSSKNESDKAKVEAAIETGSTTTTTTTTKAV